MSRKGQSTIEYVTVILLVSAGIILFGPYVIRSINAHLKSWEDSVEASVTDPLIIEKTDVIPPVCVCVVEPVACGGSPCGATERLLGKNCSPLGCEPPLDCSVHSNCCTVDDACCTSWTPISVCGGGGCGPTERPMERQCGAKPKESSCQYDPACLGACSGPTIPNSAICPGSDTPPVPAGTNWNLVPTCGTGKCEVKCAAGYVFHNGTCEPSPCPIGEVQCWSCGAAYLHADNTSCCGTTVQGGPCACNPAPSMCWSCNGTSGYGKDYSDINSACGLAEVDALNSCPWAGKPSCGWYIGWTGGYTQTSHCGCTYECKTSCTN